MNVCVIGQGYVGLNVAIAAAISGHKVIGFDIDEELVLNLEQGKTLVPGISQKKLIKLIKNKKYEPTTDPDRIQGSSIIVIAVPTPLNSKREPELDFLKNASTLIGKFCTEKALIINESTSYPGTLRNFIKPLIEITSNIDFIYASAPERIDPGNESWNIYNTPRIIGGLTSEAGKSAEEFYSSFCRQVHIVSSPEVAEAAKLFENTFRQINIALVNEFSIISDSLGFSTSEAIKAAATKPFGFMTFFPSIGVGGHCIPVDPSYLSFAASKVGVKANFIELANSTNLSMVEHVVNKIEKNLKIRIPESRIQIVGVSYKPNVSDLRESPAINLIKELKQRGAKVIWHDPIVKEFNGETSFPLDPNIDLGLIVTPHDEIDYQVWKLNKTRVLDLSANSSNFGWPKFL